jgi:hypothetical protein
MCAFAAVAVVVPGYAFEYSVNWDNVPTSAPARVTTDDTNFGNCICNLSPDCDPDCCCDPDCSGQARGAFTGCAKEVAGTNELVMCSSRNEATRIYRSREGNEPEYRQPVAGDAVCIVRTNLPSGANSFAALPSTETINGASAPQAPVWPARDAGTVSTRFKVGDRLPYLRAVVASTGSGWDIGIEGSGYISDPRPLLPGGQCSSTRTTGFMEPHRYEECSVAGSLESLCALELNPAAYRFMALTPPGHSLAASSGIVGIKYAVANADTGAVISEAYDPSSTFRLTFSGVRRQEPSVIAAGGSTAGYDSATSSCTAGIIRRHLVVQYATSNTDGLEGASIESATMTFYVGNITANSQSKYWVGYETTFVEVTASTASDGTVTAVPTTSDAAVPPRQGNPGYIAGTPLLAGRTVQLGNKVAVAARLGGLTIPTGRMCSSRQHASVRFMHNTESSCAVNVTASEFFELCFSGSIDTMLKESLTPQGAATGANLYSIDRVGFTANARGNYINDWVNVSGMPLPDADATAVSWSSTLKQCANLRIGVRYTVLVSRAGPSYNPQDVIVGVRATPITGAWRYRSTAASTLMDFTFKVEFVRVEGGTRRTIIAPPTILPSVEEDVWFPFRREGQSVDTTAGSGN